ncbi:MAG: hypothetical protein WBG22_11095 [Rhodanobacter sp.]|jgi:hypothetical protein
MTSLTRAIVDHDLAGIEAALAGNASLVDTPENGWQPVEWAVRTGNFVTLARFLRAANRREPTVDPKAILGRYIGVLADDEYEPYTREQAVEALWEDLYFGTTHMVGRFKRPLVPSPGQAEDLKFLISWYGATSPQALLDGIGA